MNVHIYIVDKHEYSPFNNLMVRHNKVNVTISRQQNPHNGKMSFNGGQVQRRRVAEQERVGVSATLAQQLPAERSGQA